MRKPFVTAEIGINHNGDISIAKKLIDMAVRCNCDAVKFQKRTIEAVYSKEFLDSPRQSPWGTTQREQKLGLEFNQGDYEEIQDYCSYMDIPWYASAWDIESQKFLKQFDLPYNKIASAMIVDDYLVEEIALEGKTTFVSTGLNNTAKVEYAVRLLEQNGCKVILMHCIMKYPCPTDECQLAKIPVLIETYGLPVGYSSHNPGTVDSTVALALGAKAIEKHITLDRSMYGSDQSASLEENGLHIVVRNAQIVDSML